ncbi:MAG: alpha/beta fold hydrolase [Gemmiger sp.]|uniref:alpha/beta fold hydrolase n=1 Tax=Gemmiger sp. TaxID=2049027 RepID=UPI002E76E3FB|nr:alpha/beta fold hydrolase [Gemmiger sp.]MEE0800183.1 alpha/beta fold hydrolase [Gemmiger sp.]
MPNLHCETFSFPSSDTVHRCAAFLYTRPDVPVRAVLQLSHGMCEYVRRYEPMAAWFAAHGIALAGHDHLGHGDTASPGEYGHYGVPNGRHYLLRDLRIMNGLLKEKLPEVPVFLYGHSMGSFYARWYAETWPETIRGLILSGTAGPSFLNTVGEGLAAAIATVRGETYVSPLMVRLNFGGYCKRIPGATSPNDWLTRDKAVVEAYDRDPLCTFRFTVGTYREMLAVLRHVSTRQWARRIPKNLPVLLLSGAEDPVGDYGAGVRQVWTMLGDAGVEDLTCEIWEDCRHELHNECNREDVFAYLLDWLQDRI